MKSTTRKTLITLSTIVLAAVHGVGHAGEAAVEDKSRSWEGMGNNGGGAVFDSTRNFERQYEGSRDTHHGQLSRPTDGRDAVPRALFRDYVEPRPLPRTEIERR